MLRAVPVVGALLATSLLAACGGDNPYCVAVEKDQASLNSFRVSTSADFAKAYKAVTAIAETAPATSVKDWDATAAAMRGVIRAHRAVGITIDGLKDETKRAQLSTADIDSLNKAYDAFNDTEKARTAMVADAAETCDITLK